MKKTCLAVMACGLCLVLGACSQGTSIEAPTEKGQLEEGNTGAKKQEKPGSIIIKYSTWASDGEAAYEGMKKFKELVEQGSEGDITVELFPSNQIGTTEEQIEQVSLNTVQMMSSGNPGSEKLEYLALPYLFSDNDKVVEFLKSDLGQQYNQEIIDQRNIYNINLLPRNSRIVSCNTKIEKPEDFEGVKIRVPERDYYVKTFEAFGANPTPMDMGEVYSAIQTGVVSGQENPIETIVSYGFQNVCNYLIVTDHMVKPAYVAINSDFYNGLSEEYQTLISNACDQAREYAEEILAAEQENYFKICEDAGMEIIKPDLAPFKEVTQSVRDELGVATWGEESYKKIQEMAESK